MPPQYSTHDWTTPTLGDFDETWVDVKSPGNGRTYSVGTARALTNNQPASLIPLYSNERILPQPVPFFYFNNSFPRQVVVLQVTNENYATNQGIVWQAFFNGNQAGGSLHANARGISVWAGPTDADTRIAICGETASFEVPYSQDVFGIGATSTQGHGFIAVYDGGGALKWSHLFFDSTPGAGSCAITDVSIRVETNATTGVGEDVVTYCGISSYGNPPNSLWLRPIAPFSAPPGPACANAAGGDSDNGLGQWDGIVGRLRNSHANPTTLVPGPSGSPDPQSNDYTDFHSIVGGTDQDGLFGIDEIDADNFVVVGSTGTPGPNHAGNTLFSFPFTTMCPALSGPSNVYMLGTALVFDASTLSTTGRLTLRAASPIGNAIPTPPTGPPLHTIARDVIVRRDWSAPISLAVIVGSTDDTGLLNSWTANGPQTTSGGSEDAFILSALVQPQAPLLQPLHGTFVGGIGKESFSGIQSWNEYLDYFVVAGTFDGLPGNGNDIATISFYMSPTQGFAPVGSALFGGPSSDRTAVHGAWTALPAFESWTLRDAAGGGVAVDSRARVTVAGATDGAGYPITLNPAGRPHVGSMVDAVRTVADLRTSRYPVGRTDGTGTPPPAGVGPYPPPAPLTGGTTPECALAPFGNRIGGPAPPLQRMFIDVEHVPGGSVDVLVIRTPSTASTLASALQIGFPGFWPGGGATPYSPLVFLPDGVLYWSFQAPVVNYYAGGAGQMFRYTLPALPPGLTVTAQLLCLLGSTIPGGLGAPPNCSGTPTLYAASPGIWITF